MIEANEVVITGFSAGGLATYLHLDHLVSLLPSVLYGYFQYIIYV